VTSGAVDSSKTVSQNFSCCSLTFLYLFYTYTHAGTGSLSPLAEQQQFQRVINWRLVLWSGKGEGGKRNSSLDTFKKKNKKKTQKREREEKKERGTRVHVSAEEGLAASEINCANNSCPQKDKPAGVGRGSQSWPRLSNVKNRLEEIPDWILSDGQQHLIERYCKKSTACCMQAAG